MRSFASDNNSGVHPLVMQAVIDANQAHAVGYGDDPWTERAAEAIRKSFGSSAIPFFVFNGTGANTIAIKAMTRSYHAVLAANTAHIVVDECGAPARFSSTALVSIDTTDGKLSPELLKEHLHGFGDCHHSQPKLVYISQVTELGTLYSLEEVRRLADFVHSYGMYLHMDGARLANACAALDCSFREMTVEAGVDILSFGGTKNGMMMGEVVICFDEAVAAHIPYYRKQATQLASKMRYMSAQFLPYLEQNLWLDNAKHANAMAVRLYNGLKAIGHVEAVYPLQSNALFLKVPKQLIEPLMEKYFFYVWNEAEQVIRLVCSWDTSEGDIEEFLKTYAALSHGLL